MTRRSLSIIIAAAATFTGFISLLIMFKVIRHCPDILAAMLMVTTLGGAFASYIIGGGLGTAFRWAFGMAKLGWFIVPVFPVDICTGIIGFFCGFIGLMFLPLFPVLAGGRRYDMV